MRIEVWGYDRRNPFWPASTDGLVNLLGGRDHRIDLYWASRDLGERLGARRSPGATGACGRPARCRRCPTGPTT
ncbi:MAG: hypothetical protein U1F53_09075 [Burkholderiaceae bacterium]